jgi:hypothetical protein
MMQKSRSEGKKQTTAFLYPFLALTCGLFDLPVQQGFAFGGKRRSQEKIQPDTIPQKIIGLYFFTTGKKQFSHHQRMINHPERICLHRVRKGRKPGTQIFSKAGTHPKRHFLSTQWLGAGPDAESRPTERIFSGHHPST